MADVLGIGRIGAGASGAMHAAALREVREARLVAVADVDATRVQAFAETWGVPRTYGSIEGLLSDPEIDVVHICTPPFLHEPQALAAMASGKHVLVEKPIARTVAEAKRIVSAAREARIVLGGVFQHRHMPLPRQVKEVLESGRLGRLYLCDAYVKWWREDAYYKSVRWRGTRDFEGGGAMINQGIHTIDLLLWVAGPVVEVSGEVATLAHPIEMEDVAVATLRFASGALGVLEATTTAWPGFAERIELHGSGGSVILDEGEGTIEWRLRGEEPRRTAEVGQQGTGAADPTKISLAGHQAEFRDFYAAIRDGRKPAITGEEAIRALAVIEAIRLSSELGKRVAVPRA